VPPRLGALIAVVFWGLSFVATKTALAEVSPVSVIAVRFVIGTATLLLLLAIRRQPLLPDRASIPWLLVMGFFGVFVHQMLQAYGLTMTSAVHTGWLIGLIPIWSALFAALVLHERFGPIKLLGLLIGCCGALVVVTRGRIDSGLLLLPSTRGDLLILASTVNWALYSVLGHGTIKRLGAARATAGAMSAGTLMLLPIFFMHRGWQELPRLSTNGWLSILFLAVGCSALGYLFWYNALRKVEASRVAALLYLEPLVTLVAAVLLLGEPVAAATIAGGILVLAGVVVVQNAPLVTNSAADERA
jgi:drug/metabolite transporter (DMT)-like permease